MRTIEDNNGHLYDLRKTLAARDAEELYNSIDCDFDSSAPYDPAIDERQEMSWSEIVAAKSEAVTLECVYNDCAREHEFRVVIGRAGDPDAICVSFEGRLVLEGDGTRKLYVGLCGGQTYDPEGCRRVPAFDAVVFNG